MICPPTTPSPGFSAGGTNLLFEDNHVVNGDDCLTVGSGAKNIRFRCFSFYQLPRKVERLTVMIVIHTVKAGTACQ